MWDAVDVSVGADLNHSAHAHTHIRTTSIVFVFLDVHEKSKI
jgi:hypothetical protein